MPPPEFTATTASVTVTLHNRQLVGFEDQIWLKQVGAGPDTTEEQIALVETKHAGRVAKRHLAALLPDTDIERLLAAMTAKGLLERVGRGGGTCYQLSTEVTARAGGAADEVQQRRRRLILDEIARRGSLSAAETAELLDGDSRGARRILKTLTNTGQVKAEGNTRARRYHLPDPTSYQDPTA